MVYKGQSISPVRNLSYKHLMSAFTLVELLVTICVLGIILTLAIPSFREMLLNSRLNANTDSFVNALNYARSSALDLAVNVKVCPLGSLNSTSCGTNWENGWIVVTQPTTGTAVLLKSQQSSSLDPVMTSSVSEVIFDTHGLGTTQSNFTLCDDRGGSSAHSIQVMATGYVQTGETPGLAVWNNSALACP